MESLTETILKKAGYDCLSDRLEICDEEELPDIFEPSDKEVYKIETVERVYRKFLLAAFLLRKKEYEVKHGDAPTEVMLHHTAPNNVTSILDTNLDWRRVTRAKYGTGVSFTKEPSYGHEYSQGYLSRQAIIVTEVLVKNKSCEDYSELVDTTVSSDDNVYVKYRDDEFFPKFVIHYSGPEKHRRFYYRW